MDGSRPGDWGVAALEAEASGVVGLGRSWLRSGMLMTRMMRSVELARSWRPLEVRRRREKSPVESLEEWMVERSEVWMMLM